MGLRLKKYQIKTFLTCEEVLEKVLQIYAVKVEGENDPFCLNLEREDDLDVFVTGYCQNDEVGSTVYLELCISWKTIAKISLVVVATIFLGFVMYFDGETSMAFLFLAFCTYGVMSYFNGFLPSNDKIRQKLIIDFEGDQLKSGDKDEVVQKK